MVRPGKGAAGFANDPFFAGGGGGRGSARPTAKRQGRGAARASESTAPRGSPGKQKRRRASGPDERPGSKLAQRKEDGLEVHSDDENEVSITRALVRFRSVSLTTAMSHDISQPFLPAKVAGLS